MKITEVTKPLTEAPTTFTPTHYGGAFGANSLMAHSDGKIYWMGSDRKIQPWQGNPNADGILGRFNPATVRGKIVNGQKVPYGPGENFANDPTNRGPQASTWKNPDEQPQAAKPVTGAKYDQGLLRRGSRGAGVKELQAKLGMPESEQDGIFGPKTEAAVKKLQQSQGIKVDGIVGPETRATIEKLAAPEDNSAPAQTPPTPTTTEPDPEPTPTEPDPEPTPTEPDPEPTPTEPDPEPTPTEPDPEPTPTEPVPSGVVAADTIKDRLSPEAQEKFDDQMQEFNGDLLAMLVDAKKQSDDFWQRPAWRAFYEEVFGIQVSGGKVTDVPSKGIINIDTIPNTRPGTRSRRGTAFAAPGDAAYDSALGRIKYKAIDDMEESRIIDLAGVNMKKKLDEASININGADANEVAEILRMMQLAGATDAKVVGPDDINPGPKPCPICGKVHGPSQPMGGCGAKPKEPEMGDMIRMMSSEEEEMDGDFQDASTEPDPEYAQDVSASIPAGNDLHKEKGAYPATQGGDNPMALEDEIKERLMQAFETYKDRDAYDASQQSSKKVTLPKAPWEKDHDAEKGEKPDYADLDGDGNEDEAMKDAAKDKKAKDAASK